MKNTDKLYVGDIPFRKRIGDLVDGANPHSADDRKAYVWKPNYTFRAQMRIVSESSGYSGVAFHLTPAKSKVDFGMYRMNNADFWDMLAHTTIVNGVTAMETWTFRRASSKYSLCMVHA